jgi:hypothetical protein
MPFEGGFRLHQTNDLSQLLRARPETAFSFALITANITTRQIILRSRLFAWLDQNHLDPRHFLKLSDEGFNLGTGKDVPPGAACRSTQDQDISTRFHGKLTNLVTKVALTKNIIHVHDTTLLRSFTQDYHHELAHFAQLAIDHTQRADKGVLDELSSQHMEEGQFSADFQGQIDRVRDGIPTFWPTPH